MGAIIGSEDCENIVGGEDCDDIIGGEDCDDIIGGEYVDDIIGGEDCDDIIGGKDCDDIIGGEDVDDIIGALMPIVVTLFVVTEHQQAQPLRRESSTDLLLSRQVSQTLSKWNILSQISPSTSFLPS